MQASILPISTTVQPSDDDLYGEQDYESDYEIVNLDKYGNPKDLKIPKTREWLERQLYVIQEKELRRIGASFEVKYNARINLLRKLLNEFKNKKHLDDTNPVLTAGFVGYHAISGRDQKTLGWQQYSLHNGAREYRQRNGYWIVERDAQNRPKQWHHINFDHSDDIGTNVIPVFFEEHVDFHLQANDFLSVQRLDSNSLTEDQKTFAGYQRFLCQVFRNTFINRMADPEINRAMIAKRDSYKVPWYCSICKKYGLDMYHFLTLHGLDICHAIDILYPGRNHEKRHIFEDYCLRNTVVWDEEGKRMVPREAFHGKYFVASDEFSIL